MGLGTDSGDAPKTPMSSKPQAPPPWFEALMASTSVPVPILEGAKVSHETAPLPFSPKTKFPFNRSDYFRWF